MAESEKFILPPPSPEQRRAASGQFERANQVIAKGDHDYGIQLLLNCCKLDPANLIYRQTLRQTERAKYKNNLRGSRLAFLTTWGGKAKVKAAKRGRDYLKVLELGERVLARNPWDSGTQRDMAEAAGGLGLLDLAIWILEQARQKNSKDAGVNRALAGFYEQRGNFTHAMHLWELVRQADPQDAEAQRKSKDLAAKDTIARGRYQEMTNLAPGSKPMPSPAETKAPGLSGSGSHKIERAAQEAAAVRARIEADPTNYLPYMQLAGIYRRTGQLDQARAVLEEGLGPTGNNFDLAAELADLEIEPFRRNLAITEEKLKSNPPDEELRKIRIRLLKEINTRELDLYRQKADRYPTEKGYRFELGLRLLRAGQIDEAIRELQAVRADPRHHWRALMYLGHCFKTRNNWRLAERNFEEALQHLPPNEENPRKELLFHLATGSAEAGDLAKAVDFGHELANLDFGYRDIGRLLDEWQARLEQADVSG